MPPPSSPGGSTFHYFEGELHLSAKNTDYYLDSWLTMTSCDVRDAGTDSPLPWI
jgi:hypothetical protein